MSAKRATGGVAAEGALRPVQQPPLVRLRVAVEMPQHSAVAAPLDYLGEASVAPGSLVRVPLGRRIVTGIVWDPGEAESP
jgi:hypothetical protein